MKQMNGERRQETCFFKEVVSEIKRGCDVGEIRRNENDEMESDGLNELVRGGYLVGFKGVAMVKKVKPDTEECRGKTSVAHDDLDDSEEDGSSSSSPSSNPFIGKETRVSGLSKTSRWGSKTPPSSTSTSAVRQLRSVATALWT